MPTIYGNGQKKHAEIYAGNTWVGRVIYYYYNYGENNLIRLLDQNKKVTAQFFLDKCDVVLDKSDTDDENVIGE